VASDEALRRAARSVGVASSRNPQVSGPVGPNEGDDPVLSNETIRELLLKHWGDQACQHPANWPAVLARLMTDAPASPHSSPDSRRRGSLKPAVDEAVAALAAAFADGPPADPATAVWRAFPKLDHAHCASLAAALTEAAHG
jgi:hypothetical protein